MDHDEDYVAEPLEEPFLPLKARNERSRVMGNYYRDLAVNYDDYYARFKRTGEWPVPPFPVEPHVIVDGIF